MLTNPDQIHAGCSHIASKHRSYSETKYVKSKLRLLGHGPSCVEHICLNQEHSILFVKSKTFNAFMVQMLAR